MTTKEILLSGGRIECPYTEDLLGWVGTARVFGFEGGYGVYPKYIVEIPTLEIHGHKDFKCEDIDNAISLFERLVYNEKNLCYKRYEAMMSITQNNPNIDLDNEEDYSEMEEARQKLIKNKSSV